MTRSEGTPVSSGREHGRDPELERAFLDAVEHNAPTGPTFSKLVFARLADGDRTYAGSFQQRSATALAVEAGDEALDLVAWSMLALSVAERSGLQERDLTRFRADLQAAATASATAFQHLGRAIGVLIAAEDNAEQPAAGVRGRASE